MQTASYEALVLIPLLPLLGATILTLLGARMDRTTVSMVALGSVFGSFAITCISGWFFLQNAQAPLQQVLWSWMAVGRYNLQLTLGLDQLALSLMLVVTGVGFLIHLYSTEYMKEDPAYWRYFAYLNFFIFSMSVLVLGRSLPVMFIGWEGVGLASYLLIGFWYSDLDKAKAGMKAFVTNRVGDFGFLIGTFTLLGLFGTVDFLELKQVVSRVTDTSVVLNSGIFSGYTIVAVLTFACLMLFVGATGKSAQIPLFIWLPDAMAGPTPVSALIHAATMVTAGVYMVCRVGFLFDLAPIAGTTVAWVGGTTAVFAATIGLAQNDIKKVLAYSTVSQLGYMFLAAGLGAYAGAMFHVITHAFFKACLFLGSGAVIHALHGEQDIRKMGGLKKHIPWVYWTFAISTLALSGIAPLSGFFSKDGILAYAYQNRLALWVMGASGAFLTALYMTRLVCMTFFGKERFTVAHGHDDHGHGHDDHGHDDHGHGGLHIPGFAMVAPLVILAILAVFGGALNLPHVFHLPFGTFLEHFLEPASKSVALTLDAPTEYMLMGVSTVIALAGIGVGFFLYGKGPSAVMEKATQSGLGRYANAILYGKWFIDEIYQIVIIGPLRAISSLLAMVIDPLLIDGLGVRGPGYLVAGVGRLLTRLQTGNVQSYAGVLVLGVAALVLWSVF